MIEKKKKKNSGWAVFSKISAKKSTKNGQEVNEIRFSRSIFDGKKCSDQKKKYVQNLF